MNRSSGSTSRTSRSSDEGRSMTQLGGAAAQGFQDGAAFAEEGAGDLSAQPALPDVSLDPAALAAAAPGGFDELLPVLDVPVELAVEIGRTTMTIGETLTIGPGSIIALKRM